MNYKTELHCHTSPVSRCASSTPEIFVSEYTAAGYTTVVLTNHFSPTTFMNIPGSWEEKVNYYYSAYTELIVAAKEKLNVLFGAEITVADTLNDYLVYGVNKQFLFDHPNLLSLNISQLSALCRKNGLLLFQAHPFRKNMTVVRPDLLDGLEVDNGNIRHNSSNPIANAWADRFNLNKITGSDYHDPNDLTACGIATDFPITTKDELLEVLKNGEYETLHSGLE